ncbi:hypothetical protein JCM15765_24060 [Paradesulfitobacterium aromaticivorans]
MPSVKSKGTCASAIKIIRYNRLLNGNRENMPKVGNSSQRYNKYRYYFALKMLYYKYQIKYGGVLDSLGEAMAKVARRDSTWSR